MTTVQFQTVEQQRNAAKLGMWLFLATEVMLFGGLIVGYSVYRFEYPEAFRAGSDQLSVWSGTIMTTLLLLGSWLVAATVVKTEHKQRIRWEWTLLLTTLLGAAFLTFEFHEYGQLIGEGLAPGSRFDLARFADQAAGGHAVEMFFLFFFTMTSLHAFHVSVGICLLLVLAWHMHHSRSIENSVNQAIVIGLYWHFVDLVWLFLFPMFYLV